jgi:hypothetical protein
MQETATFDQVKRELLGRPFVWEPDDAAEEAEAWGMTLQEYRDRGISMSEMDV